MAHGDECCPVGDEEGGSWQRCQANHDPVARAGRLSVCCGGRGKIEGSADAPGSFPPARTKATQLWMNLSLPNKADV